MMVHGKKNNERLRDIIRDAEGNIIYTGKLCSVSGDRPGSRRMSAGAVLLLTAAAVVGSGCIDAPNASGAAYVVFPYIGEMCSLFALGWYSAKLLAPLRVRKYVYDSAAKALPGAERMLTVFALTGAAASGFYLAKHGAGGQNAAAAAYIILKLAAALLAETFIRLYRQMQWDIR